MSAKNTTHACLALAFVLLLSVPAMLTAVAPMGGTGAENRRLAEPPSPVLALSAPAAFASAFESFFNDNFKPKELLVRWNNLLRLRLFGESPVKGVRVGQGRWLFYSNEWDLEDYENIMPYRPEELQRLGRILEERRAWLAARGIDFYILVAPNKSSAYSEFLPPVIHKIGQVSRFDQVTAYLAAEHPDIVLVDPRRALAEAKTRHRTYDYTDTHWNAYGAFIGYQELMARISERRPSIRVLDPKDFDVSSVEGPGGDLAGMLTLKDLLREERITLTPRVALHARDGVRPYSNPVAQPGRDMVVKEISGPIGERLPKALVFRDSFSWQLIPFLSESFRSSVYVWTFDFLADLVEREKPDVVILQCVERYLNCLILDNPPGVKADVQAASAAGS